MGNFRPIRFLLDLLDVNADDITDGQVVAWDSATSKFVPADNAGGGSGGAPTDAKYIVQTSDADLSAEQALGDLATGLLKNTTATGVLSIATEGTDYTKPGGTDVAVADGGTGASTASGARTNLGVVIGTDVASQSAFADHSARHENGGADEISLAGLDGTPTALQTHLDDTSAAHAASAISIADAGNDFTATDVEGALAELQSDAETDAQNLADHLADTSDAHDASAISVLDTAANFAGTDVEAVLAELQDNIDSASGTGAPTDATYIVQTANGSLSAEQALSELTTGLVKVANGTGVLSTATANMDYAAATHASRHQDGGADEMSVAGLSGQLADSQPSDATLFDSGAATDGQVLTADGAGGAAWETPTGGSGTSPDDVSLIVHMEVFA